MKRTYLFELSSDSATDEDYENQTVDAEGVYSLYQDGVLVGQCEGLEEAETFIASVD